MEKEKKSLGSIEAQVVHNVSVVEFNNLINSNEGIVLDVRTINEVNEGHIKDATNIDFYASFKFLPVAT